MAKKAISGREYFEKLQSMNTELLLDHLMDVMKKASPILHQLPEDEEHQAPIQLWIISGEVGRRLALKYEEKDTAMALLALSASGKLEN